MMRITFLLTQDLESPSGLGRYAPLARELAGLGHAVTVLALHPDFENLAPERRAWQEGGLSVRYVAPMHVRKQGSRKTYYSPLALLGVIARATAGLLWEALRQPADLVWIAKPHPMNGVAGVLARLRWGCRLFLDCDDDESGSGNFQAAWQRRVVAWFEGWLPRRAERVTTNTLFTFENILRAGTPRAKLCHLPNGVDAGRFQQPLPAAGAELRARLGLEGREVILYVGSMALSSHAVDLLLQAFGLLAEGRPAARLLLVGGGEDYEKLRGLAAAPGLAGRVLFSGRVSPEQVSAYYTLARAAVDPVDDTPAARGRSPLKMFEAWIMGVPFVTAEVGERRFLAGDPPAALLTRPGDAAALARALTAVLDDPALADDLRRRGLARVRDFTWDRLARRVQEELL